MKMFPVILPEGGIRICEIPDDCTDQYSLISDHFEGFLDFTVISKEHNIAAFVDDEGLIKDLPMNIPVALTFGIILAGPVLLTSIDTDEEGNSMPPPRIEPIRQVTDMGALLGACYFRYKTQKDDPGFRIFSFDEFVGWTEAEV